MERSYSYSYLIVGVIVVGLVVAVVGAALGVVFLLTGGDGDDETAEDVAWGVSPWVAPGSGGAAVGGRF